MKIWYSICGEGLGHVNRSLPIISLLKTHSHDVHAFTYGHGISLVNEQCDTTIIPGINFSEHVSYLDILKKNFSLSRSKKRCFEYLKTFQQPDLIISDFEPLLVEYAKTNNIPCICIDNQHKFASVDWSLPWGLLIYNCLLSLYLKWKFNVPSITATFHSANDETVFPLISDDLRVRPTILVYVRSCYLEKVLQECEEVDADFIVYTNAIHEGSAWWLDNITFKQLSDGFKKDLLKCDGVICNSGNQLISECISLNKRILCFPIIKQYEQYINAHYVKKYGHGMSTTYKKLDSQKIEEAFLLCPKRITKQDLLGTIYALYLSPTST